MGVEPRDAVPCPDCGGEGFLERLPAFGRDPADVEAFSCDRCGGEGVVDVAVALADLRVAERRVSELEGELRVARDRAARLEAHLGELAGGSPFGGDVF